jgi:hypothetical protein
VNPSRLWLRVNIACETAQQRVWVFLAENAALLALSVAVGVFAHGYELTHLTFSIDEEIAWQSGDGLSVWLHQRRWGMYLLQRFLLPHAVYPFTSAALAIVFLSLSAVLLVARTPTSRAAKAVFCALFVSFPTFAHVLGFSYMGASFALALALVVVAERLLAASLSGSRWLAVPALGALALAVGCHQSLLFVFPTLVAFDLCAAAFRNELSYAEAARRTGLIVVIAAAAVAAYFAVSYACGLRSDGYLESNVRWGAPPPRSYLAELWRSLGPFLEGAPITYALLPTLLLPTLGLLTLAARTQRKLLAYGLTLVFLTGPLFVHLAFGTWMSSRSMMALPFVFAGAWYLLFTHSPAVVRTAIAIFTCYAVISHSSAISRVSLTQELTYRADTLVASRLLDLIHDVRPTLAEDSSSLAFVGRLDPPRSELFLKDEVFGSSFWAWDGGNPYRMYLFLQSLGMPTTVKLAPPEQWPRAMALSRDMPRWPARGCVQLRDGLVIVKLSEGNTPPAQVGQRIP